MELHGLNLISEDAYFLRLKDKPNMFIHPEPKLETKREVGYIVAEGSVGAGIWHKKEAMQFITDIGAPNLEMVRVSEILKHDGSKN